MSFCICRGWRCPDGEVHLASAYGGLFFSWCTFCQSASNHFSTIAAHQSQKVVHQLGITYKPSEDQIGIGNNLKRDQ
jgi:hypothetical protein